MCITGIDESDRETWEDCERKLCELLHQKLKIPKATELKFERVHRIGPYIPGKTRNLIAKFTTYKDRDTVWQKRTSLKGSNHWILEDYPTEIQQNRKILYPALREALKLVRKPGSEIKKASMSVDSLIINGKKYTVKDMDKLPPSMGRGNGIQHRRFPPDFAFHLRRHTSCKIALRKGYYLPFRRKSGT